MKPFCQFCKAEGHWGNQCPKLKAIASTLNQATKTPRVITRQIVGAGEHVPSNITRRPIAFGPRPGPKPNPSAINQGFNLTPTAHPLQSVDHPGAASFASATAMREEIKSLQAEVKHLKQELAKRSVTVTPVTVTSKPRNAGNALTPAEKQRAYRARKKTLRAKPPET